MEGLTRNVIGPRDSSYISEQDLRNFLVQTFGAGIQFNIRVRASQAQCVDSS